MCEVTDPDNTVLDWHIVSFMRGVKDNFYCKSHFGFPNPIGQ